MEKIAKNLQLVLMVIILISTVIAVGIEMNKMFLAKSVTLADLLLMFLYLEVLAMVRVFWDQQSISITFTTFNSNHCTCTIYYSSRKRNGSNSISL